MPLNAGWRVETAGDLLLWWETSPCHEEDWHTPAGLQTAGAVCVTATVLYCTIHTSDSHWISIWPSRSSYVTCISDIFKLNSQLTRAHFQIELICNLVTGVLYTVCVAPLLKYQYKWLDWGTSDPWHSPSGRCGTFHNSYILENQIFFIRILTALLQWSTRNCDL